MCIVNSNSDLGSPPAGIEYAYGFGPPTFGPSTFGSLVDLVQVSFLQLYKLFQCTSNNSPITISLARAYGTPFVTKIMRYSECLISFIVHAL